MKINKTSRYNQAIGKFFSSDFGQALILFTGWRILITALGVFAALLFPNPANLKTYFDFGAFLNIWSYWDGTHYLNFAINGFSQNQDIAAFFPLLPLLTKLFGIVTFGNYALAGLIVTNLATLSAIYFFIKLVRLDFSKDIAFKSVILLLCYPTAFFLGSLYTESLFLFTTIATIYFARKNRWLATGVFGFLAALTRNLGVFLIIPLFLIYLQQNKKPFRPSILAVAAPGLGLMSYMAVLYQKFGDPLKFVHAQASWGREIKLNLIQNFWINFKESLLFFKHQDPFIIFDFLSAVLVVTITILAWKKMPKSYSAWSIVLLLPTLLQNMWSSVNRYTLVIFPIFIYLAIISEKNKTFNYLWLMGSTLFLALNIILFVNWHWAG